MPKLSKRVLQIEWSRRGVVKDFVVSSIVSAPRPYRCRTVTVHARQASRLRTKANPRDPRNLQNRFGDASSKEPRRRRLCLQIWRLAGNESLRIQVIANESLAARRKSVSHVAQSLYVVFVSRAFCFTQEVL